MSAVEKYPDLNRANALKWIEALESGKYPQTTGVMRRVVPDLGYVGKSRPAGYCCLGVLCDVSGVSTWDGFDSAATYAGSLDMPPAIVDDWLGVNIAAMCFYSEVADRPHLTELNDERGWTFDNIASLLRAEFDLPKEVQS